MRSIQLSAAVLLSILVIPLAALAQQPRGSSFGHMWNGGPWMFVGPLIMIAFVAGVVAIIVLIFRRLGGSGHDGAASLPRDRTALDILKERFARGEIDKDEFEQRRRTLGD